MPCEDSDSACSDRGNFLCNARKSPQCLETYSRIGFIHWVQVKNIFANCPNAAGEIYFLYLWLAATFAASARLYDSMVLNRARNEL
jgi:hypothetical protein